MIIKKNRSVEKYAENKWSLHGHLFSEIILYQYLRGEKVL